MKVLKQVHKQQIVAVYMKHPTRTIKVCTLILNFKTFLISKVLLIHAVYLLCTTVLQVGVICFAYWNKTNE